MYRKTAEELALTNLLAPLLFGYFAWPNNTDQKLTIKEAGSGVFVAPRLGLSAGHVAQSFVKFDPQFEALSRRKTLLDPQYNLKTVVPGFESMIYQVTQFNRCPAGDELPVWKPETTFVSPDTDIVSISVEPRTAAVSGIELQQRFLEWHLLPPPVRSSVRVCGLEQAIEFDGTGYAFRAGVCIWPARVERHHRLFLHGFADFPVYELDCEFPAGFSGAPVIYNGRLAGIFIGPRLVACLWPLAIHKHCDARLQEQSFAVHFDTALIAAHDWDKVKGHVHRVPCADVVAGLDVEPCTRKHISLKDSRRECAEGAT